MKKRVVSAIIAGFLVVSTGVPVFATPNSKVNEARQEYKKIEKEINEIQNKIYDLNAKIEPIVESLQNNKQQISQTNREIDTTNIEVEQTQKDIEEKEKVLGLRLREMYKSGGQSSYLTLIFGADSFSDLINKIDVTNRVVDMDKEMVDELNEKKATLNEKIVGLKKKKEAIKVLQAENQKKYDELQVKMDEQDALIKKSKAKRESYDRKYLSVIELELVQGDINILYDSKNSKSELQGAINRLRAISENQLKSPIVKDKIYVAIENGKKLIEKKKQEELFNRGEQVSGSASAVLNEAYKHIGKWYEWGARGPNTFDCSGFTQYVYRHATGITLGWTTYDQINNGREVSRSELQPGDLVFPHPGHVGIYVGGGSMIHAPQTGEQVKVSPVYQFWRARRILK